MHGLASDVESRQRIQARDGQPEERPSAIWTAPTNCRMGRRSSDRVGEHRISPPTGETSRARDKSPASPTPTGHSPSQSMMPTLCHQTSASREKQVNALRSRPRNPRRLPRCLSCNSSKSCSLCPTMRGKRRGPTCTPVATMGRAFEIHRLQPKPAEGLWNKATERPPATTSLRGDGRLLDRAGGRGYSTDIGSASGGRDRRPRGNGDL